MRLLSMSINHYQKIVVSLLFCGFIVIGPPSFSQEEKQQPAADEETPIPAEKSSYVYDLRSLIEKSRGNIKRVNEKIKEQSIAKRNLQREEKAREYYDRAMALFDEGKINEARELFEKSIRITEHPEMKDYIKVSEKKFKSQAQAMRREEQGRIALTTEQEKRQQEQVRTSYQDGERFYKMKNYKAARDEFTLVEQLIPEYKATRSYLKLLEEKIAEQDKVDIVNQKKEIVRQQKEADDSRIKEKELWYKELELKEQERQRKLQEQAKKVYAEAMNFYKQKNFIAAKEKFQEVEWVVPDYRSTRRYLEQIDADIKDKEIEFTEKEKESRAKQDWDDELIKKKAQEQAKKDFEKKSSEERQTAAQEAAIHYQKATDLLGQKKYTEARDEFLAVQKVYPEFKGTDTYLARLNNELGIVETAPAKVADLVRGIYANALADFNRKDFGAAKLKFEQVEFMYPDYMATRKYLDKLSKQMDKEALDVSQEEVVADAKAHSEAMVAAGAEVDKEGYQNRLDKAEPMYVSAVGLFEEKKFDEALQQFKAIEETIPNYKATRAYLKRVENQIKRVEQQRYKEEQTQQAETINLLAKQANALYAKILLLASDRTTSDAQKKFAMVDRLFANMSKEQARLLREIAEEEEKLRLEEIAYEQEVQRSEFTNTIDPIYQEAVRLYREQKYDEAKAKFLEAQSKIADYRSSKRYLNLIEKQNELLQQTIKDRESQIAQFRDKASENAELAAQLQLKAQERAMIKDLLDQAAAINDEIVGLAKDKNFEAIKEKFAQLEKIVDSLLTIKSEAVTREEKEKLPKRKPRTEKSSESSSLSADKKEEVPADSGKKAEKEAGSPEPSVVTAAGVGATSETEEKEKEVRNRISKDRSDYEASLQERKNAQKQESERQLTVRKATQESRAIYNRALKSFRARNYSDARAQFLLLQNDPKYGRGALSYIEKIDQDVLDQQLDLINKKEKQQDRYLEERAERGRMSFHVNESTRYNQVQATPRAPVAVSSSGSAVPLYVSPRQQYLSSLNLRGKNPPIVEITDPNQVSQMKTPEASNPSGQPPVSQVNSSSGVSPNEDGSWIERRRQKRLSDRRKKYIEDKEKEKQKAQEAEKKKQDELKAEAIRKSTENRQKVEGLNRKTAQRQIVEKEAKIQKIREIEAKARAQNQNLRKAKAASTSANRQIFQEQKLRSMYEQDLRTGKSGAG
ncbi:MAG: hypothetical protein JNN05_07405, partial [Candidatus Omnitrophica bacterium]|nr:hypothetical protein [Candidatus Omnitrophota bacterium]